ncbi:MAG: hypothetical protein A2X23_04905 [Chloroflexi bacterium GWC2_73_18]|nr:MAG: hypothetical protein A2X23_04905 [Chloroflexi bacterium GWC2_73_18]
MSKARRGRPDRDRQRRAVPRWLLPAAILVAVAAVGLVLFVRRGAPGGQVSWASLRTQDVHSLAFVGGDPDHVLFGHHGGLLESRDGGRTWSALPIRDDAMSVTPATDGSIVIAGHEVFAASRDGGATWSRIPADLPSLDIHGFTRDPADPGRMWAYVATGGLWESTDFGAHWVEVRADNVLFPLAVRDGSATRLLGVDTTGLVTSSDDGRTWATLGAPPTYPMTSLAASADGQTVYAGAPDGLFRSDDGGRTWSPTGYRGSAFAVATTPDGGTVAVVNRETEFHRSADRGSTWPGP